MESGTAEADEEAAVLIFGIRYLSPAFFAEAATAMVPSTCGIPLSTPEKPVMRRTVIAAAIFLLAACSSSPKVIQPSSTSEEIRVVTGTVVQVELPSDQRVRSVAVGNPKITATPDGNVVSISAAPEAVGETNMILRTTSGQSYQYRIVVDK